MTQAVRGTKSEVGDAERPLRLERRGGGRTRTRGQGAATFVDPEGRLSLSRVTLVDRSDGGLGVRCPVQIAPGATFLLSIDGASSPVRGVVAHARARGGAYRLGLRCSLRMAA